MLQAPILAFPDSACPLSKLRNPLHMRDGQGMSAMALGDWLPGEPGVIDVQLARPGRIPSLVYPSCMVRTPSTRLGLLHSHAPVPKSRPWNDDNVR